MVIDWQLATYNLAADVARLETERDAALRERDEARALAAEMWGHAQTFAGGEDGCSVEYLNDQARVYPWLVEEAVRDTP
jgi:hypothetical protein